ncbi:hypothetical protein RJT34_20179 [Clitoria ternatea]|uniref:Uncharacterized protein n=1 Tax=Clitoria ternatea TaxID=43366 RepID=A0AAN9P5I2_CLITE
MIPYIFGKDVFLEVQAGMYPDLAGAKGKQVIQSDGDVISIIGEKTYCSRNVASNSEPLKRKSTDDICDLLVTKM